MFEIEENGNCANCFHTGKCLKIATGDLQSQFILLCENCLRQGINILEQGLELSAPGNFMIVADSQRCPMCSSSNVLPTLVNGESMMVCQTCGYSWE